MSVTFDQMVDAHNAVISASAEELRKYLVNGGDPRDEDHSEHITKILDAIADSRRSIEILEESKKIAGGNRRRRRS